MNYPYINPFNPSDDELLIFAKYLRAIVAECDLHAPPGDDHCPWAVIGRMTTTTEHLERLISARIRNAEDCRHQWLRPDNGTIECATCGAARDHFGA